jgi:hypothetical protein
MKIMNFFKKHSVAIGACVIMALICLLSWYVVGQGGGEVFTSIGQNMNVIGDFAVGGNVGIGTGSVGDYKLSVEGVVRIKNLELAAGGHDDWPWIGAVGVDQKALTQHSSGIYTILNVASGGGYIDFRVDNNSRMRMLDNGKVGINVTSPLRTLHVDGNAEITGTFFGTGGLKIQDYRILAPVVYSDTSAQAANVYVNTAGRIMRSTSSLRYKTDINDYKKGLSEVLALRPVTYKGINDGDTLFAGFIAEQVEEIGLTEFVIYDEKNRPDAVQYPHMIALLTKGIQELHQENEELKNKVQKVEEEMEELIKKIGQ